MTFSYTGLAFLLGFFSVGLLSYRFFQYWQEEKNTTSKLFFWFAAILAFSMLAVAIIGLFFAGNTQFLRLAVVIATASQAVACAVAGYMIVNIKFPSVSSGVGLIPTLFLGLWATFSVISTSFSPYLEPSGGINWQVPLFAGVLRAILFIIVFLPLTFILIQQANRSSDAFVKTKAFGLSLLTIFSIILGFIDFLFETVFDLPAISSAIAFMLFSIIVFFLVFATQKPPSFQNRYTPSSSPKIQW